VPDVLQIEVPVPYLGSVNVWLLRGEPLTLVDTGPSNDHAFAELERQLTGHGVSIADIELLLITHHHLDHSGLASRIKRQSGAQIAAHRGTAQWGKAYHERAAQEHRFTLALIEAHGVPEGVIADSRPFFDYIVRESTDWETDRVLRDGDTVRAGDRTLHVVFRPGHSTTDTLFVDESTRDAFVGDHLLAKITSGAELMPTELPGDERRRGLLEYLSNLRKTGAMQLGTCYTGHGPTIDDHRTLIEERMAFHTERLGLIERYVDEGCDTAYEISRRLWSDEVAETQTVLAIWEVVGHLDILVNRGTVMEQVDELGRHFFRPRDAVGVAAAQRAS
jgi:glyoxylase-like metal-dependent hydrolase (beta-lactamase superfamily II)